MGETSDFMRGLADFEKPSDFQPKNSAFSVVRICEQPCDSGLEVIVLETSRKPRAGSLQEIHKDYKGKKAFPVLVISRYQDKDNHWQVEACGISDTPQIYKDLDETVEKLAKDALMKSDRHKAQQLLEEELGSMSRSKALRVARGVKNEGLLSTHNLRNGVRRRSDWKTAQEESKSYRELRGNKLLERLGFERREEDTNLQILLVNNQQRAVAVFLQEDEPYNRSKDSDRLFDPPIARAIAKAEQFNLKWVISLRGGTIRLYASSAETGLSSGARDEKYFEIKLELLNQEDSGYLHLLFSADALRKGGSLDEIVAQSRNFATGLGERLRERVYNDVVPKLANAVAKRTSKGPGNQDLDKAYEQVMLVLFRLLFVAYAEDLNLLPMENQDYQNHSLTTRADLILRREKSKGAGTPDDSNSQWNDVKALWCAIDKGNKSWDVPQYNGGLFSDDPDVNSTGAEIYGLDLTNEEFEPVLAALLIDNSPEGRGKVDFRDLSVREFGTIYEGLLESQLSRAEEDLALVTTKKQGDMFAPAKASQTVEVKAGEIYLHGQSGKRKSTGSYFTKEFAVQYLLEKALKPSLERHERRIDKLLETDGQEAATKAFFDFRCADIAMGSGHFLVAAVDMIADHLANYLKGKDLQPVKDELERLRAEAKGSIGDAKASKITLEMLLRRQVARRCIYGVDMLEVGVELARLALWVHTFVPGLPLSNLDKNLVYGDSLSGVGSLDEATELLGIESNSTTPSLFRDNMEKDLQQTEETLAQIAENQEATASMVADSREQSAKLDEQLAALKQLFDLATAKRAGVEISILNYDKAAIAQEHSRPEVGEKLQQLAPLHFPIAFPEVFVRNPRGFDCLLGNPPWEKVKVDKHAWWCLRIPGVRGKTQEQMKKSIDQFRQERSDLEKAYQDEIKAKKSYANFLNKGIFALGAGDTDLYQAFAWRFWQLLRHDSNIGIVLPRTALQGAGLKLWRKEIFANGTFADVATLINKGEWVFEGVHQSYEIALCAVHKMDVAQRKTKVDTAVSARHDSLESFEKSQLLRIPVEEFLTWSDMAAFPTIPTPGALDVFRKIRAQPYISSRTDGRTDGRTDRQTDRQTDRPSPILLARSRNSTQQATEIYSRSSCERAGHNKRCRQICLRKQGRSVAGL